MEPPTERSAGLYIRLQIRVLNAELDWSEREALLFRKLTKTDRNPHTCIASLVAYGFEFEIQSCLPISAAGADKGSTRKNYDLRFAGPGYLISLGTFLVVLGWLLSTLIQLDAL